MGYYIQTPQHTCKAQQLVDFHGARIELGPFFDPTGQRVGVCVVENGPFDAAGIVYSKSEMEAFSGADGRSRIWLSLTREKAIALCPHVEDALPVMAENKTVGL